MPGGDPGFGTLLLSGLGGVISAGLLYYGYDRSWLHRALLTTEEQTLAEAVASLPPSGVGGVVAVRGPVEPLAGGGVKLAGQDQHQVLGKLPVHVRYDETLVTHAIDTVSRGLVERKCVESLTH
jgi:hypothetical protein